MLIHSLRSDGNSSGCLLLFAIITNNTVEVLPSIKLQLLNKLHNCKLVNIQEKVKKLLKEVVPNLTLN